jgi:hypothetical protein
MSLFHMNIPHPALSKRNWFPASAGMVKGEKATSLERVWIKRGRCPLLPDYSLDSRYQDKADMPVNYGGNSSTILINRDFNKVTLQPSYAKASEGS